jgi:hypothetical protein
MTNAQQELKNYITANFESLVSDPAHWAESDIFTPSELDHYLLVSSISDTFKDVYGVRPRHYDFNNMTVDELKALNDSLYDELDEENRLEAEMHEADLLAEKLVKENNAYRPNLAFSQLASLMQ